MSMREALMEMAQNQSEAVAYNTKAAKSRLDDRRETNSRMLKRDFNKSGISHVHSTKTGPDGSKYDHFNIGKHTKVISTHNSYKVLHKGKETHYQGDPEHRDNRNRVIDKVLQHVGKNESIDEESASFKKAAKDSTLVYRKGMYVVKYAKSRKGPISVKAFDSLDDAKNFLSDKKKEGFNGMVTKDGKPVKESVERAAWVPESIADEQVEEFMEAALAAVQEGKDTFVFEAKHYKAKTKKEDKLDPVGQADADIDNDGDVDSSDEYLHKRRKAIKKSMGKEKMDESVNEASAPGATAQHGPDKATTDTYQKQMNTGAPDIPMGDKEAFVNQHNMEVGLDAEQEYLKNKAEVENSLKRTPGRLGDQKAGDTSFVNPIKGDIIDGITKALQQMKTNN